MKIKLGNSQNGKVEYHAQLFWALIIKHSISNSILISRDNYSKGRLRHSNINLLMMRQATMLGEAKAIEWNKIPTSIFFSWKWLGFKTAIKIIAEDAKTITDLVGETTTTAIKMDKIKAVVMVKGIRITKMTINRRSQKAERKHHFKTYTT